MLKATPAHRKIEVTQEKRERHESRPLSIQKKIAHVGLISAPHDGAQLKKPVNDSTLDYARFPRLFHFAGEAIFLISTCFDFLATPDRAQREQPIGGLGLSVRARVRSVWRVEV